MRSWLRLAGWLARGQVGRFLPALAGLVVGVFLLVFFVALGEGIRRNVVDPVLGALPDEVLVMPSEERVKPGFTMDPMETFTQEDLRAMLAMPGVAAVHPQIASRFDVVIAVSMDNPLPIGPKEVKEETKGFLVGVPAALVQEDVRLPARRVDPGAADPDAPAAFRWEPGQEKVPVLLSPFVATVWNTAFAESFNLPRVSRDEWIGRTMEISIGWRHEVEGVVVGFSRRVDIIGVPRELVEHFNRQLTPWGEGLPGRVHVKVEDQRHLATVVAGLTERDWYVTDEGERGRRVSRGLRIGETALGLVGVVLVIVSLANLSTVLLLSLRERRYELAVLRAYGAGRWVIAAALGVQTGAAGLLGALSALVVARAAAGLVDAAVLPLLEPALGAVGSLFHLPGLWILGVVVGAPLAAVAAAAQPALVAGRMNLAQVLRR